MTPKLLPTVLLMAQATLTAQDPAPRFSPPTRAKIAAIQDKLKAPEKLLNDPSWESLFDRSQILREFVFLYTLKPVGPDVNYADRQFQARHIDRQYGESAAGGATTSLVSKTGISGLFSAALENGALSRSSQGTVTTFRVQASGVYSLFHPDAGPCTLLNPVCDTPFALTLRGISGSVSIDNNTSSNTTTTPVVSNTTGTPMTGPLTQATGGGRFSGASFRYELLARQNIKTQQSVKNFITIYDGLAEQRKSFLTKWTDFLDKGESDEKLQAAWDRFTELSRPDSINKTIKDSPDPKAAFERQYFQGLQGLWSTLERPKDEAAQSLLDDVVSNSFSYTAAINQAFSSLLLKPKFTVEYTHASPQNQSPTSNIRFLGDLKFGRSGDAAAGSGDYESLLTFNGAFTFYEKTPQGLTPGRWRDAQVSAQYDRKLGSRQSLNRPVFSLSGYYQYQINNAILEFDQNAVAPGTTIPIPKPAAEVLNTTGHIGIVQSKLTLRLSETVSIPIAVSWSNRTELIKASAVRGQFGISIDLDRLLAKSP